MPRKVFVGFFRDVFIGESSGGRKERRKKQERLRVLVPFMAGTIWLQRQRQAISQEGEMLNRKLPGIWRGTIQIAGLESQILTLFFA